MASNRIIALTAVLTAAVMSRPLAAQGIETQGATGDPEQVTFTVDVAEDFSKFVYTPVNPNDAIPKRGATFVTEGSIFPGGTIPAEGAFHPPSRGPIGSWTCRGIHLVAADQIPDAPIWVHTAQLFQLPDDGREISTEGLEGSAPMRRAVTGATGPLKGYVGEQRQEFLGFNETGGVNLRVTFVLRKATN
jgi:hypothetical protein